MANKGYPSDESLARLQSVHSTVEPIRSHQNGISTIAHTFVREVGTDAVEASSTVSQINATAHAALRGDIIRFTSGALSGYEIKVSEISANYIVPAEDLPSAPSAAVTFQILRHKYAVVDASGNLQLTSSPIQYVLDGVDTEVEEVTGTPANSRPLPVKVIDGSGAEIDFATETTLAAAAASLASIEAEDFATETTLAALAAEDFATETTLAALAAEDFATQTTLAAAAASLASIEAEDFATQTTLAAAAASLASIEAEDFATQTTLAAAAASLVTIAAEDFATETTLAAASAKLPATLGQKAMADSLAVVWPSDMGLPETAGQTVTGSIAGLAASACEVNVGGMSSVTVRPTGTWSGYIAIQASVDGTNWSLIPLYDYGTRTSQLYITTNSNSSANIGGFKKVRLISTISWTGTASLSVWLGPGASPLTCTSADPAAFYATVNLRDGSGSSVTKGQTTMASSLPVAIASNQSTLPVQEAINTSGDHTTGNVSTVVTLTAPASAVGFLLQASSSNSTNIRWRIGAAATASVGQQLQPGRDTGFIPCGANISIISESGTNEYQVQWIVR